ncbi:MAG: LamG domain-containing protein [Kofleriaceae bacterium]|nr:LamG domain-containing protein [Kofleriaceae bacterium]MBP9204823.1 LamG domain-containing protein [Kofleriaceae bacterium]
MRSRFGVLAATIGLWPGIGCGRHPFADPVDGGGADGVTAPTAPLHLRFEANDFLATGLGLAACEQTCPGVTTSLPGHGEAAQFVGAGGLELTGLENTTWPSFTAALWLRLDAATLVAPMTLFARGFDPLTTAWNTWELFVEPGPRMFVGTTTDDDLARIAGLRAGFPVVGQWGHVALTFDGRSRRLYVDGELRLADERGPLRHDASPLLVGLDRDGGRLVNHLVGALDDVMLFDRALGADEVAALAVP